MNQPDHPTPIRSEADPTTLSLRDVERIADLARLRLTDEETRAYAEQLGSILAHMRTLAAIDTDEVEPLTHVAPLMDVLADDVVLPPLDRSVALVNAPKQDGATFLVPAVFGDDG